MIAAVAWHDVYILLIQKCSMPLVRAARAARLSRPLTEDQIMDRTIGAAAGGSDRRRTSGGRFAIVAKAVGVRRLSPGQTPRALVRARARAAAR